MTINNNFVDYFDPCVYDLNLLYDKKEKGIK